jgi:hypothetical protein
MQTTNRITNRIISSAAALLLIAGLGTAHVSAQASAAPTKAQPSATPISDQELSDTQEQLIKLLRMSPTLTSAVAADPSLLSDQAYVDRSNPELGQFLLSHPDVARNPDFYLFSNLNSRDGRRDQAFKREVWPDLSQAGGVPFNPNLHEISGDLAGLTAFACFLAALIWLIRQFLENRRWSRIFKLQSEVHGRLIEKFSSTQELASYMATEAGRRFLEAAPIPVGFENEQRMPNAVSRVLTPLQIGVVLMLLGCGLLFLRGASADLRIPMLVLGTVVLMPGVGFILSAGITWVMAGRLGLIPDSTSIASESSSPSNPRNGQ